MKKFLALLLMVLFVGTGVKVVSAKGEGETLGKAWALTNKACALIAVRNDEGKWDWKQSMIDKNGDKAEEILAKASAELDIARGEDAVQHLTGPNSSDACEYLIARANKAITKGVASLSSDDEEDNTPDQQ